MKTTKSRRVPPRQNRKARLGAERLEERTLMASGFDLNAFARFDAVLPRSRGLDAIPAQIRPSRSPGEGGVHFDGADTEARQRLARREPVRLHLRNIGLGLGTFTRDHVDEPRAKAIRVRGLQVRDRQDPPAPQAAIQADAVTEWNAIMQRTVASSNPLIQSRSAAIVQLAVFEAVNAIVGDYEPYLGTIAAPHGASPDAAAIAAAHRALVALHPGSAATLDASRAVSLAAIPDGPAKFDGIAVGEAAADALLAHRADDGSGAVTPYTPGTDPGDWQPTPPAFAPAFQPGWGQVTPFGLEDGAQFRSGPAPAPHTGKYVKDYKEVKKVGAVNSTSRPQDRTDVARFYAVVQAVAVWNEAARQASVAQGKTLSENAHDFALLAMAIGDGLISVFETKYHYNRWRPVTAIRAGDTDGNAKTEQETGWLPLIPTPPHPSYPSAHGSAGYAALQVLQRAYGKKGHPITLSSPLVPGVVLNYTSWEQITDDIDDARVYGGIHFRFDQEAGALQGRRVGSYILRNYLRDLH